MDKDKAEVSKMCTLDLASPQPLETEYDRWMRKWQSETDKPDALKPALQDRSSSICFCSNFP